MARRNIYTHSIDLMRLTLKNAERDDFIKERGYALDSTDHKM